jgi:hypothetical protein
VGIGSAQTRLIDLMARYSLDQCFHVVLDGILYADRYHLADPGPRRLVISRRFSLRKFFFLKKTFS